MQAQVFTMTLDTIPEEPRRQSARLRSRHVSAPVTAVPRSRSPSGPSAHIHANNCSGPGLHDRADFGPHDDHEATDAIDGLQPKSSALDKDDDGNDSDNGDSSMAVDANYHSCPLDEADHNTNDDRLALEHGDRGGDISPPVTLGNFCVPIPPGWIPRRLQGCPQDSAPAG